MKVIVDSWVIAWKSNLFGVALNWSDGSQSAVAIGLRSEADRVAAEAVGKSHRFINEEEKKAMPHVYGNKRGGLMVIESD